MTKKDDIPIDALICFMLGICTVALVVKPLANVGMSEWWWGFFMLCNAGYILHGFKKGWAKADVANGLVIAMGPISFYSWTYLNAWREYRGKYEGQ